MRSFSEKELIVFFNKIGNQYDLWLPIKLHDGTRSLGKIDDGELALAGGLLPMKPTNLFAPCIETVLEIKQDGSMVSQSKSDKPMFIVGFTAQDLDCLEFIDRFFSKNFKDEVYFAKRTSSLIVGVSGFLGNKNDFLKIAGKNCDLELVCHSSDQYFVFAYTETGEKIKTLLDGGNEVSDNIFAALKEKSSNVKDEDLEILTKASKLVLENKVPDEFCKSIADRCITCTACTLLCPTCTCFDVFDRKCESLNCDNTAFERCRMRDSCQLDGFMREASGHNPMSKEFLRTRRRIHHKIAADVIRWGHMTCYLCGRCDIACPSGIGIKSVCRELVEKYG